MVSQITFLVFLETNESEKVANDFSLAFKAVQVYGAIQSSYQGFA